MVELQLFLGPKHEHLLEQLEQMVGTGVGT